MRRKAFADELARDMIVHPVSLAIAQLAGRIEGEQAAKGISIAVEDLVIGATALHLGFDVATHNVKHFQAIPGLTVVTLRVQQRAFPDVERPSPNGRDVKVPSTTLLYFVRIRSVPSQS